jgi:hypothetical protein
VLFANKLGNSVLRWAIVAEQTRLHYADMLERLRTPARRSKSHLAASERFYVTAGNITTEGAALPIRKQIAPLDRA